VIIAKPSNAICSYRNEPPSLKALPPDIWTTIFAKLGPPAMAPLRDMNCFRQLLHECSQVDLQRIGLPVDLLQPLSSEQKSLAISVAFNVDGSLTSLALMVLARSPYTSGGNLNQLAKHPLPEVRQGVAANANKSAKATERLSRDDRVKVRAQLAKDVNINEHLVHKFTHDKSVYVRLALAYNIKGQCAHTTLARDRSLDVRKVIAQYSRDPHVLTKLAKDPCAEVREIVATNLATPNFVLERLDVDCSDKVVEAAYLNPAGLVQHTDLVNDHAKPAASVVTLESLATSSEAAIRQFVALKQDLNLNIMKVLAQDPVEVVRMKLASRQDLPTEISAIMMHDLAPAVRLCLAQKLEATPDSLDILAFDPCPQVRQAVAEHLKTKPATLGNLSWDIQVKVQQAAASNHHTPLVAAIRLSQQSDLLALAASQHSGLQSLLRQCELPKTAAEPII